MKTVLETILEDVREAVSAARLSRPQADIRRMAVDAPPPRDFYGALAGSFGLIAEIKERSPSVGPMRAENVREAASAYAESPIVRAVSVLTNERHFGMSIERLAAIRKEVPQPVLRKDFIIEEYQIREARAFGADAILLMANVLDAARMAGFYDLTRELGMEAIFEVHTSDEIHTLPAGARVVGINSRKFKTSEGFVGAGGSSAKDFSLDLGVFGLVDELPKVALKVAESGISPSTLDCVREKFQAALVGTSLLRDPRGLRACLREFEEAAGKSACLTLRFGRPQVVAGVCDPGSLGKQAGIGAHRAPLHRDRERCAIAATTDGREAFARGRGGWWPARQSAKGRRALFR